MQKESGGKDGKSFYKLMNNAAYGKTMEKINKIDVKLVNNKKGYLKWTSKASYMSQKNI